MGADTVGRIKGYIPLNLIAEYIGDIDGMDVTNGVSRHYLHDGFLDDLEREGKKYALNDHAEGDRVYSDYGFINTDSTNIFYNYESVNYFENEKYYNRLGLSDMVSAEVTCILARVNTRNLNLIRGILSRFGGGWLDEDDCDGVPPYWVDGDKQQGAVP